MKPVLIAVVFLLAVTVSRAVFAGESEWHALNLEIARLYAQGDVDSAIRLAEESLAQAKKEFGPSDLNTAKALNNLANLYFRTGRLDEAGWMYEDALAIEEAKLGRDSVSAADTLYNSAMLLMFQKNDRKARIQLDRALAVYRAQTPRDEAAVERVEKALQQISQEVPAP